jgi:hypothetical protein
MTTGNKQNRIAGFENPTLDIVLIFIVKINAQAASSNQKNFLRIVNFSGDPIVEVCVDQFPRGVPHVG